MTTTSSNLGDHARYAQYSPVRDLTVIPFGFTVNAAGAITAADNANPPHLYAIAGANNQEYILKCPIGNPAKVWVYITCEADIVASVSDYSTVSSGTLTIDLDAEPAAPTRLKGYIAYGRNFGEGKGAVLAAPDAVAPLASTGHYPVTGLLRQTALIPVGWTVNGSNVVTETRGPLGVTVAPQGSGVYHITFDHNTPPFYPENWADLFGASDGRNVSFTYSETNGKTTVIVTFEDAANMGNGERAGFLSIGAADGYYPANYGGASGGVHSDLVARDVQIYTNYPTAVPVRGSSFIPVHAAIAASTAGPTEATSNLAPGCRIVRTGAGVYVIYIGQFDEPDLICGFNLSNGTAVGVTALDGAAGTITVTAVGGDPGACALNGFIFARINGEP